MLVFRAQFYIGIHRHFRADTHAHAVYAAGTEKAARRRFQISCHIRNFGIRHNVWRNAVTLCIAHTECVARFNAYTVVRIHAAVTEIVFNIRLADQFRAGERKTVRADRIHIRHRAAAVAPISCAQFRAHTETGEMTVRTFRHRNGGNCRQNGSQNHFFHILSLIQDDETLFANVALYGNPRYTDNISPLPNVIILFLFPD